MLSLEGPALLIAVPHSGSATRVIKLTKKRWKSVNHVPLVLLLVEQLYYPPR